jgi:hypothetical protein
VTTSIVSLPPRRCPLCCAALEEEVTWCWLCGAEVKTGTSECDSSKESGRELDPWLVNGTAWVAVLVVVVVMIGVLNAKMPALGWMFGLTVLPAVLFTLGSATLARMMGRPWEPLKKLAVFLAAVSITTLIGLLISVLLVAAALVALAQLCFESLGPP